MGNLDYEIPVYTHDEMGYLSASLNYMAAQLKDMDDYQKKSWQMYPTTSAHRSPLLRATWKLWRMVRSRRNCTANI